MKSFVFSNQEQLHSNGFTEICNTTLANDLILHLKNIGITKIYYNGKEQFENVINTDYLSVKEKLGSDWLAVYVGSITRQSPFELKSKAIAAKIKCAISMAPSATPWEETTILTNHNGLIETIEKNPPPENTKTNLCFSDMIWIGNSSFNDDFENIIEKEKCYAFLLNGYWKSIRNRENYLLASYNILMHEVFPWPHIKIPKNGRVFKSKIPNSVTIIGVLWVDTNCTIEENSTLDNCILLKGSSVGKNCNLRNCLLLPGVKVKSNTTRHDKYLSIIGD